MKIWFEITSNLLFLYKTNGRKGTDVTIPANAGIELILTQPITVNPASSEN